MKKQQQQIRTVPKHGNHGEFCFKNFLRVVDYAWAFDYRRKTIYLRNFLRDFRASVVKRA